MNTTNQVLSFQSDNLQRFIFDNASIRGEWVHLNQTWQEVINRREYPKPIRDVLGQLLAAAGLLAATVKIDGRLVMQVKSSGPLSLMVVECTSNNTLRALAQWDEEADIADDISLADLTGEGTLVISIEVEGLAKPYQGIVSLDGSSISGLLETYFKQSEQLSTRIWLAANDTSVSGLFVQQLPSVDKESEEEEEHWSRVSQLAATVTDKELLDLEATTLLNRLFYEEQVRLLAKTELEFACNCSRERVAKTISLLGQEDAMDLLEEQGQVEVACEFCNEHYHFDGTDIALIFAESSVSTVFKSDTVH